MTLRELFALGGIEISGQAYLVLIKNVRRSANRRESFNHYVVPGSDCRWHRIFYRRLKRVAFPRSWKTWVKHDFDKAVEDCYLDLPVWMQKLYLAKRDEEGWE